MIAGYNINKKERAEKTDALTGFFCVSLDWAWTLFLPLKK
jgi:hypothetical protein